MQHSLARKTLGPRVPGPLVKAYKVSIAVAELSRLSCRSNNRIYKIVAGVTQKLSVVWLLFADTAFAAVFRAGLDLGGWG